MLALGYISIIDLLYSSNASQLIQQASSIMNQPTTDWIVYILRCSDGTFYTGVTNDLIKRVELHNAGKGAKYTRSRLPVSVVHQEAAMHKSDALKREYQIKQMKRSQKLKLIGWQPGAT